jgi:carotenoid cleavage dioxygenase-like enzyme
LAASSGGSPGNSLADLPGALSGVEGSVGGGGGGVGYRAGFDTLRVESESVELAVVGRLPSWLAGDLVRNGPALFDAGRASFRHWFDGQAMLHRFSFAGGGAAGDHGGSFGQAASGRAARDAGDRAAREVRSGGGRAAGGGAGRVFYTNRFLDTDALRGARDDGRIRYGEFATDPCRSIFARFFTHFRRPSGFSANASVNVVTMAGDARFALTEIPMAVQFDPETLATLGVYGYDDSIRGEVGTAHPHRDPNTGDLVNYVLRFGPRSDYLVYRQQPDTMTRELLARIPDRTPGYVHSFGITEEYAVLAIFPHVVNPLSFLLRSRPFIENYRWRPELGTRFVVIRLSDGSIRGTYRAEPFFAFHHINSYAEGGELVVDACSYRDSGVIDAFYLNRLRAGESIPRAVPTRYRINLDDGIVRSQTLADTMFELPRINYGRHNGRRYRYAYGVGQRGAATDFLNQLVKLDVDTGATNMWYEAGCYPGEPVFVAAPEATGEDDGVLLSVVLDSASGTSFLLVLDAGSLREMARARVPHVVPFGFHGQFTRNFHGQFTREAENPGSSLR